MQPEPVIPVPSRRDLLAAGLTAGGLGALAPLASSAPLRLGNEEEDDDPLDRAYRQLHRFESNDVHFLSNHVPMVCEALDALGETDAIPAWLEGHLEAPPRDDRPRRPVDPEAWQAALGCGDCLLDWREAFRNELEREGHHAVLARWLPRLAPGLAGAATHVAIRTAHAARAIEARPNAIRRLELATALAYWITFYEELPWDGTESPESSVRDAVETIELRRTHTPPPRGNIVTGLRALEEFQPFHSVAGRIDVRDPERAISEITAAFAELYSLNPDHRIHFTHSVTAPSAVRLLLPYLDEENALAATRCAWQAAAGLYAVYGNPEPEAPEHEADERTVIVRRAVENGGPHAIKLTEACLREEALAPDPAYRLAAADASHALRF